MSNVPYNPPRDLLALGEALNPARCPSLVFRFPGPCGLFDLSHGLMHRLAPSELSYTYFGTHEHLEFSPGIHCFGSLAVFAPETFQVVRLVDDEVLSALGFTAANRGHVLLGVNRQVSDRDFAWVPAHTYFNNSELLSCRSAGDVRDLVGTAYDDLRDAMFTDVRKYMEEMAEVLQRGIARPAGSWYAVSREDRRRIMSDHGLEAIWS